MKKWVGVLLVLFVAVGLFAQYNSFRYQSTATLLEDNLELILDPARISWVEGTYLYTMLFNPNTADNIFSNTAWVPSFFLGGKKDFGAFDFAQFVYNVENELEDTIVFTDNTLQDLDGEGTYDYFQEYNSEEVVANYTKTHECTMVGGFALSENLNIGLFYNYTKVYNIWFNNVNDNVLGTDLLSGNALLDTTGMTSDTFMFGGSEHDIALGLGIGINENMRIGLRGSFTVGNMAANSSHYENTFWDYTPNDQTDNETHDYELWDSMEIDKGDISYMGFAYSFFTDWNLTENDNIWFEFGGEYFNQGLTEGENYYLIGDYYYKNIATPSSYEITETWDTLSILGDEIYSGSVQNYAITLDWIHTFDKNIIMGMGFRMNFNMERGMAYDTMQLRMYEYYDDGDGLPTNNDSTANLTQNYIRTYDESTYRRVISLPVCVEFPVWKENIRMRLGAVYSHTYTDAEDMEVYTAVEPGKWTIEYADGTTREYFEENPLQYTPSEHDIHYSETSTLTYTYGLGWNVSDNLTIDLMGFSNLTNIGTWMLSGTFHF